MPNIRTKGQTGEREVLKILNEANDEVREYLGLPKLDDIDKPFQRNQNQSAVGGSDLSNPYKLDIEVKRQEQLSINTWWKQTTEAATRSGYTPILIYRQSRKPWRVIMLTTLNTGRGIADNSRVEMEMPVFLNWVKSHMYNMHQLGEV